MQFSSLPKRVKLSLPLQHTPRDTNLTPHPLSVLTDHLRIHPKFCLCRLDFSLKVPPGPPQADERAKGGHYPPIFSHAQDEGAPAKEKNLRLPCSPGASISQNQAPLFTSVSYTFKSPWHKKPSKPFRFHEKINEAALYRWDTFSRKGKTPSYHTAAYRYAPAARRRRKERTLTALCAPSACVPAEPQRSR